MSRALKHWPKIVALATALGVLVPLSFSAVTASAAVKTYKSCTELQKVYKFGVASSKTSKNKGTGPIQTPSANRALYLKNSKLDKDKDGIACEVIKRPVTASKPVTGLAPGVMPSPSPSPSPIINLVDNSALMAQSLETCKLRETRNITGAGPKGFPARQGTPATGNLKIAIIPVDFSNAVGSGNPEELFSDDVQKIKEWGSYFSRGKLTYQVEFKAKAWIRAPKTAEWYTCVYCQKGASEQKQPIEAGIQELVTAADALYNFADVRFIYFVFPQEAEEKYGTALHGHNRPLTSADGPITASVYGEMGGGSYKSDRSSIWEHVIHEILHFQGFIGHGPENGSSYYISTNQWGEYKAVTAWESFINGWFAEDEILCLDKSKLNGDVLVNLDSIDNFGTNKEAVMIKIDEEQILIIERRTRGQFAMPCRNCRRGDEPGFTAYRVNVNGEQYRNDMDPTADSRNFWSYIREAGSPLIRTQVEFQGIKVTRVSETFIRLTVNR